MILIDISQISIANLMMMDDIYTNQYDDNLIKHMIYNSVRAYKVKFGNEYGEPVICCDSRKYWRKDVFKHYKASRKKVRDDSKLDWDAIYKVINSMKSDLATYFPYKVLEVEGAEADDVIAVLAKHSTEKTLIIGSDKDYTQLHKYFHVRQYSPRKKDFIDVPDPQGDLKRLIMDGDKGDGIPNIKSPSDCFITGKRQASMFQKDMDVWVNKEPKEFCTAQMLENYERNQQLIDFDFIPQNISDSILEAFKVPAKGTKETLMTYFMTNGMPRLAPMTGQF